MQPPVVEGITWTTERSGVPGMLEFKVVKTKGLKMYSGDAVRFRMNNHNIFFGFIFKQKFDKDGVISVTAYDQLRYLKNKDTYVYENMTASQVIKMIAKDFNLQTGKITDTKMKIPSRVEDNVSLFDIINNALDLTMTSQGKMYTMYDKFGKITLKELPDMKVKVKKAYLLIDASVAENYEYTSGIDDSTFNQIKLTRKDKDSGLTEVYITKSTKNQNKWGVLQKYETLQSGENGQAKADALLKLYNTVTKTFQLKNVKGFWKVRAGSMVVVSMKVGNTNKINNWMLVEKCKHEFRESEHFMTLTLRGGDVNA